MADKVVTIGANATYGVVDEDTMVSDSASLIQTQQSVKAYADGIRANVQELTASGAVTAGVNSIELNHATVVIAATIADLANHPGLLVIKDTSATGTAAHTVTATAGTFDGTNNVVTLNALNECIAIWVDSAGNGTILENVGSVAVS
jgi:hypothetical protein